MFLGFKFGFKIGHNSTNGLNCEDIYQLDSNKQFVLDKLSKEIALGRTEGPFSTPPFSDFHLSPIFLVPKPSPGDFRLILDLSYPKTQNCINSHIDDSMISVTYSNVRQAISYLCHSTFGSFSCKVDLKEVF